MTFMGQQEDMERGNKDLSVIPPLKDSEIILDAPAKTRRKKRHMTAKTQGKTVLIAVDTSDQAIKALQYYLQGVRSPGDEVVLGYVVEGFNQTSYALTTGIPIRKDLYDNIIAQEKEESRHLRKNLSNILTNEKVKHTFMLARGNPVGFHICEMAKDVNADIIVMGTRGMGTLRRTILGSVSDYVVKHAEVPVLVCPNSSLAKKNAY